MGLLDEAGGFASSVIDRGTSLASDVAGRAQSGIGSVVGTVSDAAHTVAEGAQSVGGTISSGVSRAADAVSTGISTVAGGIASGASTAAAFAEDIRNRIQSAMGAAAGLVGEFITDPVGAVEHVIGEARSQVSSAYDEAIAFVRQAQDELRERVDLGIDASIASASAIVTSTSNYIARQAEHYGSEILWAIDSAEIYARTLRQYVLAGRNIGHQGVQVAMEFITLRARVWANARITRIVSKLEAMVHHKAIRMIGSMIRIGGMLHRIVARTTGEVTRRIHGVEAKLRSALQTGHNLITGILNAVASFIPSGLVERAQNALAFAEAQVATVIGMVSMVGAIADSYRARAIGFVDQVSAMAIGAIASEISALDNDLRSIIDSVGLWVAGAADRLIVTVSQRIQTRINTVIDNLTGRILRFLGNLGSGLAAVRGPVFDVVAKVAAIARGVGGIISSTIEDVGAQEHTILTGVLRDVFAAASQGDVVGAARAGAHGIADAARAATTGVLGGIGRAIHGPPRPVERAVGLAGTIVRAIGSFVRRGSEFIGHSVERATNFLSGIVSRTVHSGVEGVRRAVGFVKGVTERVIDAGISVATRAARAVGGVVEPIVGALRTGLGFVGRIASGAIDTVIGIRDRATAFAVGTLPHDGDLTGIFFPLVVPIPGSGTPLDGPGAERAHASSSPSERERMIASGAAQLFVNGINTSLAEHYNAAQRLADATGTPVVGVYNASGGMVSDLVECAINKLSGSGIVSPTATPAVRTVTRLIRSYGDARRPNGGLRIFAHSQGSLIVSEALRQAQEGGADLSLNDVTTFGNAAYTFPSGPTYHHYVHDDDVVPGITGSSSRISALLNWLPAGLRRMLGMGETTDPRSRTVSLHHGGSMIDPHGINAADRHDYIGDLGRFREAERTGRTGIDYSRAEGSSGWAIARGLGTAGADAISSGYEGLSRSLGMLPGLSSVWGMVDPHLREFGRNVRGSAEGYSAYHDREEAAGRTPAGMFDKNYFGETMLQAMGPTGFIAQAKAAAASEKLMRTTGRMASSAISSVYGMLGGAIPGLAGSSAWASLGEFGAGIRDSVTGYMGYRDSMQEQGREAMGPFDRNYFGEPMIRAMGPYGMLQQMQRPREKSFSDYFPSANPLAGILGGLQPGLQAVGSAIGIGQGRTEAFPASWTEQQWISEKGGMLQRLMRDGDGPNPDVDAAVLREKLISASGPGSTLPSDLSSKLSGFAGGDISGAKIHTGPAAQAASRELSARAFTIGGDVFFGQGQYDPASRQGQALLAHELTHVLQQTGGAGDEARFFSQRGGDEMEREAQQTAMRLLQSVGTPDGLLVEMCFCDFEGDGITSTDIARIERLGPSAVRAAELLLEARGVTDVTIDDLEISVSVEMQEASDTEIIDAWAQQLANAVFAHPRSRAGSMAGRSIQRWPDFTWSGLTGGQSDQLGVSRQAQVPGQDPRQNFLNSLGAVKGALLEVTSMADSLLWLDYMTAHQAEMSSIWGGRLVRFLGGDDSTEATLRRWHVIQSLDDARRTDAMMAMASQGTWQSPHQYMMRIPTMVDLMRPYGLIQEGSNPPMLQISRAFSQNYDRFAEWTAEQIGADLHREDYLFLSPYEVGEIEGALAVTIGLAFVGASEAQWAVNLTRAVAALGAVGGARGLVDAIEAVYRTNPNPSARDFVTREIVFAFLNFFASVIGLSESMASRRLIQILLLMIFSAQLGNAIGELVLKIGEYQREQDPQRREAKRAEVVTAIRGVGQALIGLIQHICAMSHQTPQGQTHDRIIQESQARPDGTRVVPAPPADGQLPPSPLPVLDPAHSGPAMPGRVDPMAPIPGMPLPVPGGPMPTPITAPTVPTSPHGTTPEPTTITPRASDPTSPRSTELPPNPAAARGPHDTIPDMPAVQPREGDPHSRDTIPDMPAVRPPEGDAVTTDPTPPRPRGEPEARPGPLRPEDQPGRGDFRFDPDDPVTRAAREGDTGDLPRTEDGTVVMPRLANTFERFTNPLEANQAYHGLIDATPSREAGIWFNEATGQYVVMQGNEGTVNSFFQAQGRFAHEWRLLEHFHPGTDPLARVPSQADFQHITHYQRQSGQPEPVSSTVRYRTAEGREVTTRFGFDPNDTHPYYVEFIANDGSTNVVRFTEMPAETGPYDFFIRTFTGEPVPGGQLRLGRRRTPPPAAPPEAPTQTGPRPGFDDETTQVRPRPPAGETTEVFTRPGFEDETTQVRPRPGIHDETTQVGTRPGIHDEITQEFPRPDFHDEPTQIMPRPDIHDEPTQIMPRPDIHDETTQIRPRPEESTTELPPDPTAPRPQARPDQPGQVVTDRSDPDRFLVRELMDPAPPRGQEDNREARYFMDAQRDPQSGDLTIDVRTASDDGTVRSSQLRGRDLYDQALDHFDQQGNRITSVRSELANTNLSEFNNLMHASGHQMTFEQALLLAPSGKILAGHGFVPSDVVVSPNPPGPYTSVRVHWTRP